MIADFLTYLLETAIGFTVIYVVYAYALHKTAYFVWSRWYLLSAIIVSLVIPLLSFPYGISNDYVSDNFIFLNSYSQFGIAVFKTQTDSVFNLLSNPHFNLKNIIFVVYVSGFIRSLIVFLRTYLKIIKIIQKSDIQDFGNLKIVNTNDGNSAYSWFKYIFLNKTHNLNEKEVSYVIEHEKIHIKQCHSCDVLLYEIFGIFFWFNPLVKKSQQTIKNIHEFIVDSIMLQKVNVKEYADLLIKLSSGNRNLSVVNHFARNPILDRVWLIIFPNPLILSKIRFISGMFMIVVSLMFYSFIITEINKSTNSLQAEKKYDFIMPVEKDFQIVSPFFEKKQMDNDKKSNYKVLVSHLEISISTKSNSKVMASRCGTVKSISARDNWGVKELNIEIAHNKGFTSIYKGLKHSKVKENDTVKQSQIIGITGDNRIYPTIKFQLLKNNKAVDPMKYINK